MVVAQTEFNFNNKMGSVGGGGDMNECVGIVKPDLITSQKTNIIEEYGPNLKILPSNNQVRELQTILRDR